MKTPRPRAPRNGPGRGEAARAPAALAALALLAAISGCRNETPAPAPAPDHAGRPEPARPPGGGRPSAVPVVAAAPRPTAALAAGTSCVSAECHAPFLRSRQVHGAAALGTCDACHGPDVGDHTFPVVRRGNDLCTYCHAVGGRLPYRHVPMDEPGCVACHDPHYSKTDFLLAADSLPDLCSRCHPPDVGTSEHPPHAYGECAACHEPHESSTAGLLRGGEGAEHCFWCHDETRQLMETARYLHQPATENCETCHAHHASDAAPLLHQPLDETCFSCHDDMREIVERATSPHGAILIEMRCGNCHDAHGAGQPYLLRDRQDRVCLRCHGREVEATDGRVIASMADVLSRPFLHGPVENGECSACHNVHGGAHRRLLRDEYTTDFYQSFNVTSYALCFDCHENALVLTEASTRLTGFREGDRNLHYVHVHRDRKGRTCRACHDIHGSDLPSHIARTVRFEGSQWSMPINFEKTDDGGSCAPACHAPMSYRRGDEPTESEGKEGGAP